MSLADIFRDAIEAVDRQMGPIRPKGVLHKCAEAYALGYAEGMTTARWIEGLQIQKALEECPEP